MNLSNQPTNIAIIGMSALFPGAKDLQSYWQNILNKVNAVQDAPDNWAKPYFDPDAKENSRIYTRKGGFLGDLAEFNPVEFGIMPTSVDGGEPDHFLALKLAKEALRDAGYLKRPFNRQNTGIILGRGTYINRGYNTLLQHGQIVDQTLDLLSQLLPHLDPDTYSKIRSQLKASLPPFTAEMAPGLVPNVITGRIANRLDIQGPNYIVDAACASSLVAIDVAIKELESKRCDMVIAGGVHASTPPQINMIFCQLGALSHGDIQPFSQGADGTLLGEGLGILVLKRLEDAERDGDRIYALIKGSGISSDGKALGLLAPRLEGEVVALERAYHASGIDPQTVGLIEAHGTGIPLGDQTEIRSLTHVFGKREKPLPHCAVGSVKSMIGHCIPAAGSASLIKTALALYYKILPPTLCEQINPNLEMDQTPFYLNTEARPWIHGNQAIPRRAGINAFGFGGVNAHAVLEEYIPKKVQDKPYKPFVQLYQQFPTELLILSAESKEILIGKIKQLINFIGNNPQISLASLAYTLSTSRKLDSHERLAIIAKDVADYQNKLERILEKITEPNRTKLQTRTGSYYLQNGNLAQKEQTVLLFPGEGSQYSGMLADLAMYFPIVRSWFDFLDATFGNQRELPPSTFIFPPPNISLNHEQTRFAAEELFNMDLGSETVFTASMALYELLEQFGLKGAVMLGHSTGENAALIASKTIKIASREQLGESMRFLNQIYQDLLEKDQIPRGALLTIGAFNPEKLQTLLDQFEGNLHLAMNNCPNQAIVFGNPDDIQGAMSYIKDQGGICALLPFDRAYHTPLFADVSQAFRAFYDSLEISEPETTLYTCVNGQTFPSDPEQVRNVAAQQWSSQVKFWETIETLYQQGMRTFVEIGPSSNLTGFVDDILRSREYLALSSNNQRKSGLEQLQNLLASLYVNGAELDFAPLYGERNLDLVDFNSNAEKSEDKLKKAAILDLTMPIMSLKPDLVAEIQTKLQPEPKIVEKVVEKVVEKIVEVEVPTPVAIAPVIEHKSETFTDNYQDNPDTAADLADSKLISESEMRSPDTPLVKDSRQRLTLLSNHFELMQEFLATQGRIAMAFGNRGENLANFLQSELSPGELGADSSTQVDLFPLLGEILDYDGAKLESKRHFNLENDVFLYDHTLGGKLSQRHGELIPLPVIPFTVSMEILAEAALYLTGGTNYVIGIYDLRGYRWLALDQGELTLKIEGEVIENNPQFSLVKVRLFETSNQEGLNRHLVFEGTVKLASSFSPAPAPMSFQLHQAAPSRWSDQELYSTGMFHGPRFQGVKHIRGWDQQGIEADLGVIAIDDFFAHQSYQPIFQIDAGLLDAAGQLVGYWVSEQFGTDFNVFPFNVESFEQYEPPLATGSYILCRGLMKFVSERQTRSSFDFLDQNGRVIARLEGWQDRYFSVPHRYYQCRLHPQTSYLSDPYLQAETGVICRRIEPLPEGFLDDSWSIWKRVLAHLMLNQAERDFWYNLPEKGNRRTNWLLGRIAAKDAIRQWCYQNYQLSLAPVDMEILADSQGKPQVNSPELAGMGILPEVSISYSQGYVIAAVVPPDSKIGVDLQRFESIPNDESLKIALTPQELALLPNQNPQSLMTLWAAKEAASKAYGTGLQGEPKKWCITNYLPSQQRVTVAYDNQSFNCQILNLTTEIVAICQY